MLLQVSSALQHGLLESPDLMELDDSSTSSTITVDRKGLNPAEQPCNSTYHRKQGVTFALNENLSYTTDYISPTEYKERWYSGSDYRKFKTMTKEAASQIAKLESKNKAPFSYTRVMEIAFIMCENSIDHNTSSTPISESHFIHVVRWVEVASSRCGLEKLSIQHIGRDRKIRRKQLVDVVLSLQQRNGNEDYIRLSCERLSFPSRKYACVMGHALERAEINCSPE
jgi:hypothetical protein